MRNFHALAAVFALVVLLRNARGALRLVRPGPGRLSNLAPLVACLAAAVVLIAAVRGLLAATTPGATP